MKDKNFSGRVFYHRMDGSFVNGWRFQNGMVTGIITLAPPGTPAGPVTQSKNNPVVNVAYETDCETTITTTYWEQCSYFKDDTEDEYPMDCFDYTTQSSYTECSTTQVGGDGGGGGSSQTYPCTPPAGGSSDSTVDATRYRIRVADPNPPGGTPAGGIVDQTNQIGTNECTTPTMPNDTTTDPCKQKLHLDSLAKNLIIAKQNAQILAKTDSAQKEYRILIRI